VTESIVPIERDAVSVARDPINGLPQLYIRDPVHRDRFLVLWLDEDHARQLGASLSVGGHTQAMASATVEILDCPTCTWDHFGATGLDREFVASYRARIDGAGIELIRRPLITAWRRRGYRIRLLEHTRCAVTTDSPDEPPTVIYDEVRQEAANAVDADQLVREADLLEEWTAWYRAHPLETA